MPLDTFPREPENKVLVFQETSGADGKPSRRIAFTDYDIKPLGFSELAATALGSKVTVPLEVQNARVLDGDGVPEESRHRFETTLESHFTSKAIGLVKGGWLPSTLGAYRSRYTFLLDRNIITEIVGRFQQGNLVGREPDFLDLFRDEPVRLNPLLYALEGNSRAIPNPQQVSDQFEEVVEKLQKALPKAILAVGPKSIEGILGLIEDTRAGMARREKFLMHLAPALQSTIAKAKVQTTWNDVLAAADELNIPRNSNVVTAALSAISVPGGRSPAKQILKFKPGYSVEDAYNALADLRSLDIFANLLSLHPNEHMQLCTADKNLALFWAGIRASNFSKASSGCRFDIDPVDTLIPEGFHARWLLDVSAKPAD